MHCTLLLQTMRKHGMSHLLDTSSEQRPYSHSTSKLGGRTDSNLGVQTNGMHTHANGQSHFDTQDNLTPSSSSPSTSTPEVRLSALRSPTETVKTSTDFRALLVKTILATDMSVHGQWMAMLSDFNERQAKLETCKRPGDVEMPVDPQTRLLFCQAIIKCADISNPVCDLCPK
jgi:hypothetical protein